MSVLLLRNEKLVAYFILTTGAYSKTYAARRLVTPSMRIFCYYVADSNFTAFTNAFTYVTANFIPLVYSAKPHTSQIKTKVFKSRTVL